jgi:DNA-binding response OmpR family regulator
MQPQLSQFARAVLVEDEARFADTLIIALSRRGIRTDHASTLAAGRQLLSEVRPELVILDRNLPDGDGLELCRELRMKGYDGSILVLTALGQTEDRVKGLYEGADDYLPKPFSWDELEARIAALERRQFKLSGGAKAAPGGLWHLDEKRLRVLGPKGWAELTPLEFKLASHLIRAHGEIVTRDDLLKNVWGFTLLPKTRTVDHFLGRLRKMFEADPEAPKHFITVRGAGYRFMA